MPAIAPIALTRNSDSAVLSFNPDGIDSNGVASFVVSTGVPIADPRITIGKASTATGRKKVTIKVAVPIVQNTTVNGVTNPTVVRTAYADVTFTFADSSTTAERTDLRSFLVDALASSLVGGGVINSLGSLY